MLIVPEKLTAPVVPKTPVPVLLIVPAPEIVAAWFHFSEKGIVELSSKVAPAATVFAPVEDLASTRVSVPPFTVVGPV